MTPSGYSCVTMTANVFQSKYCLSCQGFLANLAGNIRSRGIKIERSEVLICSMRHCQPIRGSPQIRYGVSWPRCLLQIATSHNKLKLARPSKYTPLQRSKIGPVLHVQSMQCKVSGCNMLYGPLIMDAQDIFTHTIMEIQCNGWKQLFA